MPDQQLLQRIALHPGGRIGTPVIVGEHYPAWLTEQVPPRSSTGRRGIVSQEGPL